MDSGHFGQHCTCHSTAVADSSSLVAGFESLKNNVAHVIMMHDWEVPAESESFHSARLDLAAERIDNVNGGQCCGQEKENATVWTLASRRRQQEER